MKKTKKPAVDEIRSEYTRSDFGELVRGKYVEGSEPRAILQSEKQEPISKPSI